MGRSCRTHRWARRWLQQPGVKIFLPKLNIRFEGAGGVWGGFLRQQETAEAGLVGGTNAKVN